MMQRLDRSQADFDEKLSALLRVPAEDAAEVRAVVAEILGDVRSGGDVRLVELTNQLDRRDVASAVELKIEKDRLKTAFDNLDPLLAEALSASVDRVRTYHEAQLAALGGGEDWQFTDSLGNTLGQKVSGMQRVGLYAPGGKAAYPSTVIMTAIPAKVAGVEELVLCVPTPGGEVNETLLAAAYLCGVDHVFTIGGAQAIAAMAFGTDAVPRVDKIVGPGNLFVAVAKEMVFGTVGIDMIAGPSEVLIIADKTASPDWIVKDLFAQAEHDEMAQSILISADSDLLTAVAERLPVLLAEQPRSDIIAASLKARGAMIQVADLSEALALANRIAPEHLQLAIENPADCLDEIRFAGAVFLGVDTAEVVGDYTAGPSHVLPTSGTARFASPLGVYDFQIRASVIDCSREGSIVLNRTAALLADVEGLTAHGDSARARVSNQQ
ncbi:MAG: histidinol dehydrogenase [Gammaproteobacteria bacterium]